MSNKLFKEGGPHKIKKVGKDRYSMNIMIPVEEDGRIARACPNDPCSPGYFKVKPGTGITENQEKVFCPYCRYSDGPNNFATEEQIRYAEDIVKKEAHEGMGKVIEDALGLGPTRKKKINGGLISIEMSYKPASLPYVRQPLEEILKRDVICPHCGLDHLVYGLAIWCPDCGKDIFITHVEAEFNVIRKMLDDSHRRKKEFGVRVAAKDVENALEDTVSIFEAALRHLVKRHLINKATSQNEIENIFRERIGNKFQNITLASNITRELIGKELFGNTKLDDVNFLEITFQKRHPITHNLGIVDKKYLEKVRSGEIAGKDVRVTIEEVKKAIILSFECLNTYHSLLFEKE